MPTFNPWLGLRMTDDSSSTACEEKGGSMTFTGRTEDNQSEWLTLVRLGVSLIMTEAARRKGRPRRTLYGKVWET